MYDDIELHSEFVRSMLTHTLSESFVDVSDMDARLEVYRRSFMQGHCAALRTTFAMTSLYLGDAFTSSAVSYVCQHRPKAGQLFATYGGDFSAFLDDPFAKELARLEWDLQSVAMSAVDEPQMTVDIELAYWQLRSDLRLFQSEYNVGEVYRSLKTSGEVGHIKKDISYYLLRCNDGIPSIQLLHLEEYVMLDILRSPHSVGELFDKLIFSKEIIVNILLKLFNKTFLKVQNENSIYHSEMCSRV
jgi:hypothetical protein